MLPKLTERTAFGEGIAMAELNYNHGSFYTGDESADELQVTTVEIGEFKKQYDAMTAEEKARLPTWLREHLEKM
jgi:hypothetical protein